MNGLPPRSKRSKQGFESMTAWLLPMLAALAALIPAPLDAQKSSQDPVVGMQEAARNMGVPEAQLPLDTPEQSRLQKTQLADWERKLSSTVRDRLRVLESANALSFNRQRFASSYSTPIVLIDSQARLRIEAKVTDLSPFDDAYFASIGGQRVIDASSAGVGFLVAWIPATRMQEFASRPEVILVLPVHPSYPDLGAVTSEGDALHNADDARTTFGLNGTGQTVGVISDGVDNLAAAQGTGDLPAGVVVSCAGSGDEGTAMLEIVADLVPGANLAFCSGNPGTAGMINAINTLAAIPGMTTITDDLPKPGEPLFEDGPIAVAKQAAVAAGIFYTASAGNRGLQHYENFFNGPTTNVTIGPNTYANPHDFGGADYRLQVTLGNSNSLFLQWADPFGASNNDFDLFVVDNSGNVLASSTNPQTGTQDPNESLSFNATAGNTAHIIVDYVGGGAAPNVFLDLRAFNGMRSWEYLVPQGSINGASRQTEVYAAGAVDEDTPNTVEGFSSRGPIRHFFPAALQRNKPDGCAADDVVVTGAGGFGAGTCPIVNPGDVCRFSGTSASTPHVAALAALLLEAVPGLTPAQVATAFNNTAIDIDIPGPDNNAGFGRLDVFAAICSFDSEPPVIACPADVVVECTTSGGTPASDAQLVDFFAGVSATDLCDPSPDIDDDAPSFFPLGSTVVTFTATDESGNSSSCQATVEVVDTTPPVLTASVDPELLWPPNHKLVRVTSETAAEDICDPSPTITLVSVVSNEPENGLGDGDTAPDIVIVNDNEFRLRAERSGKGDGRKYTITYEATDVSGNSTTAEACVIVPHDRSTLANSAMGFRADGSELDPEATSFAIVLRSVPAGGGVVPMDGTSSARLSEDGAPEPTSSAAFDATAVDRTELDLGNHAGKLVPTSMLLADVGHDGLRDLVLIFPVAELRQLQAAQSADDGPIGFLCRIGEHTYYSVANIFALGPPVEVIGIGSDPEPLAGQAGDEASSQPTVTSEPAPFKTALEAITPNPFSRGTRIEFALARPCDVNIAVFAASGRMVRQLSARALSPGRHSVHWNGSDDGGQRVAAGIYFVRFAADGRNETRKVVLAP